MSKTPKAAANLEIERAVIAALVSGIDPGPTDNLSPSEFFFPFHRRVYRAIKASLEKQEPISDLALAETMKLDAQETVELRQAIDPLLLVRRDRDELAANVGVIRRLAKERDVRFACEEAARSNGDIDSHLINIRVAIESYESSVSLGMAASVDLFDTFEEFENSPEISFAIRGFLQNEAITAIAGLSGHGKTWLALAIARALLFGPGKLWDLFDVTERASKLIYLIPEYGRAPLKGRLKVMDLYDEIASGRLLVRTLSKGPAPKLDDPGLLRAARNSHVILDTGVRFMHAMDESSASEIAEGLSNDMLGLLRAGARTVIPLFHSPKSFLKEPTMTLEGMIRGTSELGAVLATAWGIRQIDLALNTLHVQNLKPRDFEPCGPFQLAGRPHIDRTGDFKLLKAPGECGVLADEQPGLNKGGGAPKEQREAKAANKELVRTWLEAEPNLSLASLVEKFRKAGIEIDRSSISRYRKELNL